VCSSLRDTLPIFFVSGTRTEPFDSVAGLLLVGADDYIVKPFVPEELTSPPRVLG
jgi:DNA-binding response OmpR family regulator